MVFSASLARHSKMAADNSDPSLRPSPNPSGSPQRKLGDHRADPRARARGFLGVCAGHQQKQCAVPNTIATESFFHGKLSASPEATGTAVTVAPNLRPGEAFRRQMCSLVNQRLDRGMPCFLRAGSSPSRPVPMRTLVLLTVLSTSLGGVPAVAANTGFDPRIVVFGDERERIQNTPIEQRPNRPLHFYGNSIRRRNTRTVSRPSQPQSRSVRSASQGKSRVTRSRQ